MNLFLVTSPFQYICANEARIEYKAEDTVLVLVEQPREAGEKQIAKLLNKSDWTDIIYIPRTSRTKNIPSLIKKLKSKYSQFDTYFYAEYHSWRTQLIAKNLAFKKHIYFDDGTMTIIEYEDYLKKRAPYQRNRILQDVQLRLRSITPTGKMLFPNNFELFSIFHFNELDFSYKANQLSHVQSLFSNYSPLINTAPAGFIGQAMVSEQGGVTLDCYIRIIQRYIDATNCSSLLYFPHRSESSNVTKNIKNIKGLIYHASEFPLEIELANKNIQLSCLGGIASTALYTLSLMYPELPMYNALQKQSDYKIGHTSTFQANQRLNNYYRNTNLMEF